MQMEEKIAVAVAYLHLAAFILVGLAGCNIIPTFDAAQPIIHLEHLRQSSAVPAKAARDFDFGDAPGTATGFAATR
jgi:hypothetical protein